MTMFAKIIAKLLVIAVITVLLVSDIISCSSVCESVAPNGIYRGSRMYKLWSIVQKDGKELYPIYKLVLYTRVSNTTTHEWQLMFNELDISINESTFKSIDKPIVNRFGGIFAFSVNSITHQDPYDCITSFKYTNDDNNDILETKCEMTVHSSEFQQNYSIQYPSNAIIFRPKIVKFIDVFNYHMIYDNKCIKLFKVQTVGFKILLVEMGCNICNQIQCKAQKFLDQLSNEL
ncbi:uncharacterized protein LOC128957766 [Oppia nitens]|uniref:uncharacterized protein LOC128957766 n=1 Tax=Oppia nitens TaxID=1686743 RepID=UPI0023DB3226|nr:uncharacterized protein LOC128957766 [Oppia nitens]